MNCNNFKELTITKNTTEGKQTNKNRTHELQGKLIHICQYLSGKKKKKIKVNRKQYLNKINKMVKTEERVVNGNTGNPITT